VRRASVAAEESKVIDQADNNLPESRMGLLFVLPWSLEAIGGVNEVVRNLIAQAIASRRWSPSLLVADYEARQPVRRDEANLDTVRIRLMSLWLPGQGLRALVACALLWPLNLYRIVRLLGSLRTECINIHYVGPAALTLLLAARVARRRPRVVLSFHGADITHFTSRSPVHLRLLRFMIHLADSTVCCSHDLLSQLQAAIAEPVTRGTVVHNGIDVDRTRSLLRNNSAIHDLLPTSYIANVATFEPKKGQDLLVRAFALVREQLPQVKLVLAGREGPWLGRVRELVESLDLRDRVVILTNLSHSDALRTIAGAGLFVLCSRREPFCIVLLEAAALEAPVVAMSVGGVPEFVVDGQTGLLVPSEDVEMLARQIVRLQQDAALAERLALGAAERVKEKFSWTNAFRAYEVVFRRIPR
jgi:glycosyltransferase involved in cell wall biosynthesis